MKKMKLLFIWSINYEGPEGSKLKQLTKSFVRIAMRISLKMIRNIANASALRPYGVL